MSTAPPPPVTGSPSGAPAPAGTPTALRSRMLIRTLGTLVLIVLLIGGSLLWMQSRKDRATADRKERSQSHVILRPTDEAQDWRVKEGARVEELKQTIERLERQVKGYREQQERDSARGSAPGPRPRIRPGGEPVPALPPLSEILPAPGTQPLPRTTGRATETVSTTGGPPATRPRPPVTVQGTPAAPQGSLEGPDAPPATGAPGTPPALPIPGLHQPDRRSPITVIPQDSGKLRVITPRALAAGTGPGTDLTQVGWLPSGSFIPARLLSGVDAGTGTGTNLPYPVLLRLTDLAVLPNFYQMDIADCFVIGAAFGDLPSERVYIRTETLSCLRKAGGLITIDGDLKGHIIGEDGKLGLRGRVVERTGKMIARSLLAGFLSGLSDAFKPRITYAPLTIGGTTNQAFEPPPINQSLEAAGISGVGKTTDLLAKHYLDQATKLYPIIEIESLRRVDIVLLKGLPLKFRARQRLAGDAPESDVIE